MTPEVRTAVQQIRELYKYPTAWGQGFWGHDAQGNSVSPRRKAAVCWCLEGAIERVADGSSRLFCGVRDAIETAIPDTRSIVTWNDLEGRTHADVLELLDKVLA